MDFFLVQVFLKDTDERACAYIAGSAPNRWGFTADGRDLNTLIEPVPPTLSGTWQKFDLPSCLCLFEISGFLLN